MQPHYDLTKDLRKFLRRCTLRVGDTVLDESHREDIDVFVTVLGLRVQLLSDLLTPKPIHLTSDIRRSVMRTLLSYKELDVAHYVEDWKTLREVLTSEQFLNLQERLGAQQAFKQLASTRIHYKWTLTTTALLLEGESWFKKANQWVTFDSRMNFPTLDLSEQCCRDYLEFEAHYPAVEASKEHLAIAQRIASEWFDDFEWRESEIHAHHGPGATQEVGRSEASQYKKNQHFVISKSLRYYLDERFGMYWDAVFFYPRILDEDQSYTCDLVCVPKTPVKNRTISKESTTLQFLQQDLKGLIVDHLTHHPEIPIYLDDQTKSRRLAMRGSCVGEFDTIDLSNASDSVSCTLIGEVLGLTPLYYPLMATRSTQVNVSWRDSAGESYLQTIELKKFAPMGSATCFPVESIIFAISCEIAVRVVSGTRSRVGDYLVYGDDIVIRHPYVGELLQVLKEFGFSVNTEKSFTSQKGAVAHLFREACGIECLDGEDVTPLRVSRRMAGCFPDFHETKRRIRSDLGGDFSRESSPGVSVGLCDMINRAYLYGYRELRWQLCRWLRSREWYPYVRRISAASYAEDVDCIVKGMPLRHYLSTPYIITDDATDTNYRVRRRYNKELQRHEYRFMYVTSRPFSDPHDDNTYYTWCLEKSGCSDLAEDYFLDRESGTITTGTQALKWVYGWQPVN